MLQKNFRPILKSLELKMKTVKILNLLTRALKAKTNRVHLKNNRRASSKMKKRQKIKNRRFISVKNTTSMKTVSAVHQTIRMLKTIPEKE
jgi:hypothetical protein